MIIYLCRLMKIICLRCRVYASAKLTTPFHDPKNASAIFTTLFHDPKNAYCLCRTKTSLKDVRNYFAQS